MIRAAVIEQKPVPAEAAWKDANDGQARVCARRAVVLASESWLARYSKRPWSGIAMAHLRRIQEDASFPPAIRQTTERLSIIVTHQHHRGCPGRRASRHHVPHR